jgi:hypothetical protein
VEDSIGHYENQTEDGEFADVEAAREAEDITLMAIPTELVQEVRALFGLRFADLKLDHLPKLGDQRERSL